MRVKIGDKVRILYMEGEPQYSGKEGVVKFIDSMGQIHGTWGGCAIIPENDSYEVIELTFNDIEKALDRGARNLVFITKPNGKSFMVWNYSGNSYINTFLSRFDIWGKSASCSKLYKEKFEYTGFELPVELYDVFKLPSVKLAFDRDGCNMFFEEELEVIN